METQGTKKYRQQRHLTLISSRRTSEALDLQHWLDREMHSLFVQFPIASHGIEDTRRQKQHSWRVLGRRIREVVFALRGDSNEALDALPELWREYIARCRAVAQANPPHRPSPAASLPKAA